MIETVNPQISGDIGGLEHFGAVDLSKPTVRMEKSKALETASEDVKRVLSLEFSRRKDVMDKLSQEVIRTVQKHPRDFDSLEVAITLATIKIRNLQHELIQLYPYKNQPVKHVLTHKYGNTLMFLDFNSYAGYHPAANCYASFENKTIGSMSGYWKN